jgi:hypothetical protein
MSASYAMNSVKNPEHDKIWYDLGKKLSIIDRNCTRSYFITMQNYGMSHKMTSKICNIRLISIKSTLDDMVCGNYPLDIHTITAYSVEVPLTHVFYAFPNLDLITENQYAQRQHTYKKSYNKEEKEFIEEFLILIRYFLLEIVEIDIIKQNKHYKRLEMNINKIMKALDSFNKLFRQAEMTDA